MIRKLFGKSCLTSLAWLALGGCLALFVGSIVFTQLQASSHPATVTPYPTFTRTVQPTQSSGAPANDGNINVVVETASPQPTVLPTATSLPPLPSGTIPALPGGSFPLTVTAEYTGQQTRVAQYLSSVDATRTEIAQENVSIFATLTAAAPTSRFKK